MENDSALRKFYDCVASGDRRAAKAALEAVPLAALNTPPEAYAQAVWYLRICMAGTVFVYLYNLMTGVLRGLGDARTPLLLVVITSVVNLLLDLLLYMTGQDGASVAACSAPDAEAAWFPASNALVAMSSADTPLDAIIRLPDREIQVRLEPCGTLFQKL